MNIFYRQSRFSIRLFSLTLFLLTALSLEGCGGGSTSSGADGGIIATGRALVNGNVASSTLPGDLKGIEIKILDRTTLTNANGEFSLDDVAAGNQKMYFAKGGQTASLALAIPSQSQTTLNDVHIDNDTASTESIEVEDHSSEAKELEDDVNTAQEDEDTPEPEDTEQDSNDDSGVEQDSSDDGTDDQEQSDDSNDDGQADEPKDDEK